MGLPSFINVRILFRIASKFKYRDKKQTTIKAQLLSFSDVHFQQITQKLIFRVIINSHFVNSRNSLFFSYLLCKLRSLFKPIQMRIYIHKLYIVKVNTKKNLI